MKKGTKIIIAAGGTGGHIFPAQAFSEHLIKKGMKPVLVCDERTVEFLQGTLAKAPRCQIFSGKMTGSLVRKLYSLVKLAASVIKVLAFIRKENPGLVIGFGGYPSFPTLVAAKLLGIKTVVCEQNAVLGRVNRIAARFVSKICLTFQDTEKLSDKYLYKAVVTGTPIRQDILKAKKVRSNKFRILVIGGSQGAKILSEEVPQAIMLLPKQMQANLKVAQQARPELVEKVKAIYNDCKCQVEVRHFFDDIASRIQNADLIIARAGASTIAEVATLGKAAILIPFAAAMDNHQYYNALNLVHKGAAAMLEERKFTPQLLADMVKHLINNPLEIRQLEQKIKEFSQAGAVDRIYKAALDII